MRNAIATATALSEVETSLALMDRIAGMYSKIVEKFVTMIARPRRNAEVRPGVFASFVSPPTGATELCTKDLRIVPSARSSKRMPVTASTVLVIETWAGELEVVCERSRPTAVIAPKTSRRPRRNIEARALDRLPDKMSNSSARTVGLIAAPSERAMTLESSSPISVTLTRDVVECGLRVPTPTR